jgi:lipopolysaccharide/colanic/teichoic acid biosynthesis glycosyltransferase
VKRFFDIITGVIILFFTSPALLLLYILQLIVAGKPILFRQKRIGLNGTPFFILKFRTMDTGEGSDTERLTGWGKFLRSTSLDELPELWNVLRGEMSLVGPRPLPVHYLPLYSHKQTRRHTVRPGITGWAQINGRNNISWEHQFELDLWYIDNRNRLLDLKILLLTPIFVLTFRNISEPGRATRSEFLGNEK